MIVIKINQLKLNIIVKINDVVFTDSVFNLIIY